MGQLSITGASVFCTSPGNSKALPPPPPLGGGGLWEREGGEGEREGGGEREEEG